MKAVAFEFVFNVIEIKLESVLSSQSRLTIARLTSKKKLLTKKNQPTISSFTLLQQHVYPRACLFWRRQCLSTFPSSAVQPQPDYVVFLRKLCQTNGFNHFHTAANPNHPSNPSSSELLPSRTFHKHYPSRESTTSTNLSENGVEFITPPQTSITFSITTLRAFW